MTALGASPLGSFIGGAAHQASANMEASQRADQQMDVLWGSKFAVGEANYQKEKKDAEQNTFNYNQLKQVLGGDEKLADQFMPAMLKAKSAQEASQVMAAAWDAKSKANPDPSYQSQYMQSVQSGLKDRYGYMEGIRTGASPRAQKFMSMPEAPGNQSDYGSPQNTPQGIQTQPLANPNTAQVQPTNSNTDAGTGTPQAPAFPPQQPTDTQVAQKSNNPFKDIGIKPETAYQQQRVGIEQGNQDLARKRLELDRQRKPATPQETQDLAIGTDDIRKYLHDPKTGLQARYSELRQLQSQNYDISSITDSLNRGLQASAVQPMWDELNRFTTSTLGLNLNQMGIPANSVSDVNTLKKNVANGIINRLSTLHFGRITNYEAGLVGRGFSATSNDPDTNLKIALSLQNFVRSAADATKKEYDTVYGKDNRQLPFTDRTNMGRDVASDELKKLNTANPSPWPQVSDPAQAPKNQWFEDAHDGKMYRMDNSGRLYKAGDHI